METIHSINLIATHPKVRHGRPYIIGTTVTVADIATVKIYHRQDEDGLAAWFGLSLAQFHAALTYFYEHRAEMDEQVREQIRKGNELREKRGRE